MTQLARDARHGVGAACYAHTKTTPESLSKKDPSTYKEDHHVELSAHRVRA